MYFPKHMFKCARARERKPKFITRSVNTRNQIKYFYIKRFDKIALLNEQLTQKYCHHFLTLMLLQTSTNFFLLCKIKADAGYNVSDSVTIRFHSMEKRTASTSVKTLVFHRQMARFRTI